MAYDMFMNAAAENIREFSIFVQDYFNDDQYYTKHTPEGVVSNLASISGKHMQLTILLARDSTGVYENEGLALWNAVVSNCKKNVEVLVAFGADYSYTHNWSNKDKLRFNIYLDVMDLVDDGTLT